MMTNTGKVFAVMSFAALLISTSNTAMAQSARCDGYARDYADQQSNTGTNVLGGAAAGAAVGAIIGAIVDGGRGAGRGAAIGGGTGAVGGGVNTYQRWKRNYDYAYRRCVEYRPRASRTRSRNIRSRDVSYCQRKYRSYNPRTGKYLAYSGKYRNCP